MEQKAQNSIVNIQRSISRDEQSPLGHARGTRAVHALRDESPRDRTRGRNGAVEAPPSAALSSAQTAGSAVQVLMLTNLVVRGRPVASSKAGADARRDARSYAPRSTRVESRAPRKIGGNAFAQFLLTPFQLLVSSLALPYRVWIKVRFADNELTRALWRTSVIYESSRHFWRHAPSYAGVNLLGAVLGFGLTPFRLLASVVLLPYRGARRIRVRRRGRILSAWGRRGVVAGLAFVAEPFLLLDRVSVLALRYGVRALRAVRATAMRFVSRAEGVVEWGRRRLTWILAQAARRVRGGGIGTFVRGKFSSKHLRAEQRQAEKQAERQEAKQEAKQAEKRESEREGQGKDDLLFQEGEEPSLLDEFFAASSARQQQSEQPRQSEAIEALQEKFLADKERSEEKDLVYKEMDEMLAIVQGEKAPAGREREAEVAEEAALAEQRARQRMRQRTQGTEGGNA